MVTRTLHGIVYEVHSPSFYKLDTLILEMNNLRNWIIYNAMKPEKAKSFPSRDAATSFISQAFKDAGAL